MEELDIIEKYPDINDDGWFISDEPEVVMYCDDYDIKYTITEKMVNEMDKYAETNIISYEKTKYFDNYLIYRLCELHDLVTGKKIYTCVNGSLNNMVKYQLYLWVSGSDGLFDNVTNITECEITLLEFIKCEKGEKNTTGGRKEMYKSKKNKQTMPKISDCNKKILNIYHALSNRYKENCMTDEEVLDKISEMSNGEIKKIGNCINITRKLRKTLFCRIQKETMKKKHFNDEMKYKNCIFELKNKHNTYICFCKGETIYDYLIKGYEEGEKISKFYRGVALLLRNTSFSNIEIKVITKDNEETVETNAMKIIKSNKKYKNGNIINKKHMGMKKSFRMKYVTKKK